jgi:hypothetical protein
MWQVTDFFGRRVIKLQLIEPEEAVEAAVAYIQEGLMAPAENPVIEAVFIGYYVGPEFNVGKEFGVLVAPVWAVKFADSNYGTVFVRGEKPVVIEPLGSGLGSH